MEKQRMQQRAEKADLVRLQQIRKEREAAAKKREEEVKCKTLLSRFYSFMSAKEIKAKDGVKKLTLKE